MSAVTAGLSTDPDRIFKNSITQWRHNNSGEIDVFEAARYFSGGGDFQTPNDAPPQRVLACRISLEMPPNNNPYNNNMDDGDQKKQEIKKKYKQPSSPGGKLASFLNSLFHQTTTSKKKSKITLFKSGSSKNDLEEVERKRRSSISHFRITTTTTNYSNDSKSTCGDSNITPTKPPLRSLSHHQIEMGVSAPSRSTNGGGVDQKRITSGNNINYKNNGSSFGFSDRSSTMNHYYWGDEDRQRECMRKFGEDDDEDDDGAESDSDLFDLDFCSSGNLPVYGTTHMDRIRISA